MKANQLARLAFLAAASGAPSAQAPVLSHLREMVPPDDEQTNAVALGDLDGDGDRDLFAGNTTRSRVYLYSDDTGYSELEGAIGPLAGSLVEDVALADFDGDGNLDALLAQKLFFTSSLLIGDGAGAFDFASGAVPLGPGLGTVVDIADLDSDGDLDAVLGVEGNGDKVLENVGGTFQVSGFGAPTTTWLTFDLRLGDVDGDGNADAVAVATTEARLLLGDGALGFADVPGAFPAAGGLVRAIELADFDGDGDLDVAAGTTSAADVIYAGDGAGSFAAGIDLPVAGTDTVALAAADLDGDGDLDLLAASDDMPGRTRYENLGGLSFADATAQVIAVERPSLAVVMGDVDADGDTDAVFGEDGPNRLLLQSEDGELVDVSRPWPALWFGSQVALGDWDGDGAPDAVSLGSELILLSNDGAGGLTVAPASRLPVADVIGVRDVAADDFDDDGDPDLLLTFDGAASRIYDNDGTGTFLWHVAAMPGEDLNAGEIALGDVDGDGDIDAFAARSGDDLLLRNDGAGNFTDETVPNGNALTYDVALADLDGDGDLDVYCGRDELAGGTDAWFANDGTGVFALAASFASSSTYDVLLFDADGDGDNDVLSSGAGSLFLRHNQGLGAFTDLSATLADVPASAEALVPLDANDDGDLDVYVAQPSQLFESLLLVNDGAGFFAPESGALADPAARTFEAVAADLDLDGDLDLLWTGRHEARVLNGLARQLARRAVPRLGKPLWLDVFGPAGELWLLAYSPGFASIDLGAFGLLRLDPSSIVPLASGVLDGDGRAAQALPFPADPALVGVALGTQAAVGNQPVFTNLERIVAAAL
ncbi:MAG: VCBS repeat-containing protein [Planctomycetota bacterium]